VSHSSNEPGELSQWQCHDDSSINTVVAITITIVLGCSAEGRREFSEKEVSDVALAAVVGALLQAGDDSLLRSSHGRAARYVQPHVCVGNRN